RRTGVPAAIGLTVDRGRLQEALPASFSVDPGATVDPAKARQTIVRLKLGEAAVRMAAEEQLAGAADLIVAELRENEIPLQLEVVAVGDLVEAFPSLVGEVDVLFASQVP